MGKKKNFLITPKKCDFEEKKFPKTEINLFWGMKNMIDENSVK